MAESVEVLIADAIAKEIRAKDFGPEFLVKRSYADVSVPLKDLDNELRIDVVPFRSESSLSSRADLEYAVETDVLIRKKFTAQQQDVDSGEIQNEDIDELMKLRQDIEEYFSCSQETSQTGRRLADVPDAAWDRSRTMASYVRQHLRLHRQFTGWIRFTHLISRAAGS